jgi:hypothetical protein
VASWPSARAVLRLQRTAGNRAVGALLASRRPRSLARSPATPEFVGPVLEPAPEFVGPVAEPALSAATARLAGTETLYDRIAELERADRERFEGPPTGPVGLPWTQAEKQASYEAARTALAGELRATGFASVEDFRSTAAEFLGELRERAVALTGRVLDASEQVVRAERERYSRPEGLGALFAALGPVRSAVVAESTASANSMGVFDLKRESLRPPGSQRAAIAESVEQHRRGEDARRALVGVFPILADPELRTEALAAATGELLKPLILGDADARLTSIASTRANVADRADLVFKWPRMTALALDDMGLPAGSVYERLVADRRRQIQMSDQLVRAGWAALAIGLAALTWGAGLPVAGMVAGALVSGAQVVDEWRQYSLEHAAAHTSFDTALAVSADEPSLVWVAVALLGAGLEGVALVAAFRAAAPAARALGEAGGGLAAFEAEIGNTTLSPALQWALLRAAAVEADYQQAMAELAAAWRRSLGGPSAPALGGELLDSATRTAYFFLRSKATGRKTYAAFEAEMRGHRTMAGVDWTDPTNVADLRDAYARGLANAAADRRIELKIAAEGELAGQELAVRLGRPFFVFAHYSTGPRRITFTATGDMLLDGVPVPPSKRVEVYQKADVYHAVTGHGADSEYKLIAEESNQIEKTIKGKKTPLPGKSSRFATDETMFRSIYDARRAYARGIAVISPENPRYVMVDLPAGPNVGRCFSHRSRVPAGTPILPELPFPNLKNVVEVRPTHVRAIFDPTDGRLVTIYPIGFP